MAMLTLVTGDLDDHVDLGGRGGHGDHGDLDEFDKEQPADVYDGVRDDVLVVDDVHDDLGDLGGDGVHDGHGDLGGDVHDGHGDLDDRRGGHGDRKTLWITTYSACHNTYSRYRKSCLYSSNERWECSWYAHWYSSAAPPTNVGIPVCAPATDVENPPGVPPIQLGIPPYPCCPPPINIICS